MITFVVHQLGELDALSRAVLHTYSAAFAFLCIDFDCSFECHKLNVYVFKCVSLRAVSAFKNQVNLQQFIRYVKFIYEFLQLSAKGAVRMSLRAKRGSLLDIVFEKIATSLRPGPASAGCFVAKALRAVCLSPATSQRCIRITARITDNHSNVSI